MSGIALMAALSVSAIAADIPAEVTLFKNVNVFDGKSEKLLMGYDVLVVKNLIKKVAKDIPTSGTYELDVTTGEDEKTVKKEVKVNVIDGDPTEDIRLLMDPANIDLIMKDGKIYKNTL